LGLGNERHSPEGAVHQAATMRFIVMLFVVLIAPTIAHSSPHNNAYVSSIVWSID
jgi:hypothetical protein